MSSQEKTRSEAVRRVLEGVVISDKMQKTIVVSVDRAFPHERLGKTIRRAKKFKAHDEAGVAKIGDVVEIIETAPLSKTKHMKLVRVVSAARS